MAFRRLHQAFKHLRFPARSAPRHSRLGHRLRHRYGTVELATPARVESLEIRQLLTFFGGDVFEYRQSLAGGDSDSAGGEVVRVKLDGNITVELIGAQVNRRTNAIQLVNLPGELTRDGAVTPIGGGLNPAVGTDPIGPIFTIGDNNPNFAAIAASGASTFYGFSNVANFSQIDPGTGAVTQGTAIQIYQLTLPAAAGGQINGTTVGMPIATIFAANGANNPSLPIAVTGADIAPNGDLFFVATTFSGAIGLFSVRPSVFVPGAPDEVAASLNFAGNILPPGSAVGQNPVNIGSIAFINGTLFGVQNGGGGGGGGGGGAQLITINTGNGAITNSVPIAVAAGGGGGGGGNVDNIVGLDVNADGDLIAIQSGEDASVFSIDATNGAAINLGPLGTEVATGLTFIPGVTDPFSGASGAFIGVDSADQLFFVNVGDRNPAQFLWNVYVTSSDITGKIVIGYVRDLDDDPPDPYVIRPFEDDIGQIRSINAQNGEARIVDAPGDTGKVLIGALTQDIDPDSEDEQLNPFPAQVLPSGIDFGTVPTDVLGTMLSPGLVVEDGQDLGSFMLGGTILGKVDARANLDFFYAGWILTGQLGDGIGGLGQLEGAPEVADNFNVGGDLRSLLSLSSIGTDDASLAAAPLLVTGFDLRVGGTLGTMKTGFDFVGTAEVNHLNNAPSIGRNQRESEFKADLANGFEQFHFNAGGVFFNDTLDTAEFIGSIASADIGRSEVARVDGTLQKITGANRDPNDFYAVALMAGQSYQVQLTEFDAVFDLDGDGVIDPEEQIPAPSGDTRLLTLGVFDPDNRIIASEATDLSTGVNRGQVFSFTADRPGIYRLAIGSFNDPLFTGAGTNVGVITYRLDAYGIGDIALGGIVAQGDFLDLPGTGASSAGVSLFRGDLGAIKAFDDILSDTGDTVEVSVGNLRTMDANSIGVENNNLLSLGSSIFVPEGSVGLLRASGVGTTVTAADEGPPDPGTTPPPNPGLTTGTDTLFIDTLRGAIGGNFQLIDGPQVTVVLDIAANGGIGVIRAGDMAISNVANVIEVNADHDTSGDGTIGLIDVRGAFGTLTAGGPHITTNGGNVSYIRVGGTVYSDSFFGGGSLPVPTLIPAGQSPDIIDDSGTTMHFNVIGETRVNPLFNPQLPQVGVPERVGPRMQLTTYGIRGSGGVVVIDVTSEGGLEVSTSGGSFAEVSRVSIRGIGEEVVSQSVTDSSSPTGVRSNFSLDPGRLPTTTTPTPTPTPTTNTGPRVRPEDLFLRVTGSARVDVLSVVVLDTGSDTTSSDNINNNALNADGTVAFGTDQAIRDDEIEDLTALGNAVSIVNSTGGDIVNVVAESVGELRSSGNLGMSRTYAGTALNGIADLQIGTALAGGVRSSRATGTVLATMQPFLGIKEGITIAGGIAQEVSAGKAIGNVIVYGTLAEIQANSDGQDSPNEFEGINGVVLVDFFDSAAPIFPGRLLQTRIGEGILPSGTGNFSAAGLFARAQVGEVTGRNADIRGDIVSLNDQEDLRNVTTTTDPVTGRPVTMFPPSFTPIERISLENGSLINADILVVTEYADALDIRGVVTIREFPDSVQRPEFDIGRVSISGNGGIIGTNFKAGDIGPITTGPGSFGIFNSDVSTLGDGVIGRIEAGGYGLRQVVVESASAGELVANGDGTSLSTAAISERVRFSERPATDPLLGTLDPFFGTPPNILTDIHALLGTNAVQPEISGVTDTGVISAVDAEGQRDLRTVRAWQIRDGTTLDYANSVGTLDVRDIINGLEITTGTLKKFTLAQDAFALAVNVSGRLKNVDIRGSLANNSVIRTVGDGGKFDNVKIAGNLIGNIDSARSIKSISIGGDFTGNIGVNSGGTAIKTLKVGGAFVGGSLDIVGNVGTIQSSGSLGSLGDTLTVNGNLGKLLVGGDLRANVRVTGGLKLLQVRGSIVDGGIEDGLIVDVSQTLNSLQVGGDIQAGVQINAKAIKKQKIGGQNLGEINIVA